MKHIKYTKDKKSQKIKDTKNKRQKNKKTKKNERHKKTLPDAAQARSTLEPCYKEFDQHCQCHWPNKVFTELVINCVFYVSFINI